MSADIISLLTLASKRLIWTLSIGRILAPKSLTSLRWTGRFVLLLIRPLLKLVRRIQRPLHLE
eukprot:scaffold2796_cov158-Skeletonema_dohrnii-CCMP3373.AAC.5